MSADAVNADSCNADVVVVGANGFLAQTLRDSGLYSALTLITHNDPGLQEAMLGADVVVNLSFDPAIRTQPVDPAADFDSAIAHMVARGRGQLIMASSRMVYGRGYEWPSVEEHAEGPTNFYGENKRRGEAAIRALLPDRHLILRISNVIGFERQPGRRSFMAQMLASLRSKRRVVFDHDPAQRKDFLPADDFGRAVARFINKGARGTYNLGAGFALPCRDVAEAVIAGYGAGEVVWETSGHSTSMEYYLSMARSRKLIGDISDPARILAFCRLLGERMRNE